MSAEGFWVKYGLEITHACDRACTICCSDSKPNDDTMDFSDLEETVGRISGLRQEHPGKVEDEISFLGETLLYRSGDKDLGDALDLLIDNGFEGHVVTRGFTDEERQKNLLPYRNFCKLKERFMVGWHPRVAFSVSPYVFNNNEEKAFELARNAIGDLAGLSREVDISVASSVQRGQQTADLLFRILDYLDTHPNGGYADFLPVREILARRLGEGMHVIRNKLLNSLVSKPSTGELPISRGAFNSDTGLKVYVHYTSFMPVGRGKNVKERTYDYGEECMVRNELPMNISIFPSLNVAYCCGLPCSSIPPVGNIRQNSEILFPNPRNTTYRDYMTAISLMHATYVGGIPDFFFKKDPPMKRGRHEDICRYCERILPRIVQIMKKDERFRRAIVRLPVIGEEDFM